MCPQTTVDPRLSWTDNQASDGSRCWFAGNWVLGDGAGGPRALITGTCGESSFLVDKKSAVKPTFSVM